ncbi:MAG: hypothetical protein DRR16_08730 [Candidatus Parabeggiatoa sp. nov. 3]|jgi:hypothetical protein|nr:MAG: hypothetical protein DRQ99_10610 [Gammaproteobacteria bacterium]RKZ86840.1 MAG: hypothetical protein DRR16_08730 [Gammaproteobacteria bacterium]
MKTQSLVNKIINDFLSLLQNRHTTIMSYQKFTATACPFINQSLVEETIMNILGREFITEQMPEGWVICERWRDGVLNIIDNKLSNRKQAQVKLHNLGNYLIKDCQKLGISPEQYWRMCHGKLLTQFVNQV